MFRDRHDAAHQLAAVLSTQPLRDPLVLAIPRGGVVTGADLAGDLGAELDVVLSRKLRARDQPELAIGSISESGEVRLNRDVEGDFEVSDEYLHQERQYQMAEIARRKHLFRSVRPEASVAGRSVILTDDGVATGSTMMAAIQTVRERRPMELIVAIPVAPPDRLAMLEPECNRVVCLHTPARFLSVGQFYECFPTIDDATVVSILRKFAQTSKSTAKSSSLKPCP